MSGQNVSRVCPGSFRSRAGILTWRRKGRGIEKPDGRTAAPGEWRTYAETALPPIPDAALACFVEHGYHGTAIRTIAARAGLSVPGVYHHYPSKQALLVASVSYAMEDLWSRSAAAMAEAGEDIPRRLDLLVECRWMFWQTRPGRPREKSVGCG